MSHPLFDLVAQAAAETEFPTELDVVTENCGYVFEPARARRIQESRAKRDVERNPLFAHFGALEEVQAGPNRHNRFRLWMQWQDKSAEIGDVGEVAHRQNEMRLRQHAQRLLADEPGLFGLLVEYAERVYPRHGGYQAGFWREVLEKPEEGIGKVLHAIVFRWKCTLGRGESTEDLPRLKRSWLEMFPPESGLLNMRDPAMRERFMATLLSKESGRPRKSKRSHLDGVLALDVQEEVNL